MIGKIFNLTIKSKIIAIFMCVFVTATALVIAIRAHQIEGQTNRLLEERLAGNANMTLGIFDTVQVYTELLLDLGANLARHGLAAGSGMEQDLNYLFNSVNLEQGGVNTYENILVFDRYFALAAAANPAGDVVDLRLFAAIRDYRQPWASPSFVNPVSGRLQLLFARPVFDGGERLGTVAIIMNTERLEFFLRDFMQVYDSFVNIADGSGTIFFSNREAYIGRHVDELGVYEAFGGIPMNTVFAHTSALTGIDKIAYVTHDYRLGWTIVSFFDAHAVESTAWLIFISLLPTVSGLIIAAAFVVFIIHRSLKPLNALAVSAKELAKGNVSVKFAVGNDEIGQVSGSFLGIVTAINILRYNFKSAEKAMARGDTEYSLNDARLGGIFDDMLDSANNIVRHLEKSVREKELASRAKSDFLATMSHEIRTPLNAIIGISEIELDRDESPRETKDSLNRIYNSGHMLLTIINDLLDLSKIESGRFDLVPVKYEMASLINDTARLNMMRIGSKPIEFIVKVKENLPLNLIGDELRIKQILNNLISNAVKYTEKGSVTLEVDFRADNGGITLVFAIHDTGQGMTKEQLNKLYDEYAMFNREANRATEGTGLGMSITKSLVDIMGGKITVESEVNAGSVFTVLLPQERTDDEVLGKELAENLQSFQLSDKTRRAGITHEYMPYGSVLVVDDVEANLFVAKGLMKPYGLVVETAMSGSAALDKILLGNKYDIIFMDHMMPGLDGIETTRLIRDTGYSKPIVALTANAVIGQREVFLGHGFDGFMSKPVDVRELDAVLKEWISRKYPETVKAEWRESRGKTEEQADCASALLKSRLESIKAIDAETAIEYMGGSMETYAGSVKLMARLLPETIDKMDKYLNGDIEAFTVEVHGLKSVLRSIGAANLGNEASRLENAGIEKNAMYCGEFYPPFRAALFDLCENLNAAFPEKSQEQGGDRAALASALDEAKAAAEIFDRDSALEIAAPLAEFTYTEEIDALLKEIMFALEAFDCEGAVVNINKLKEEFLYE